MGDMTAPVMEGCEPLSVDGGSTGVLVLHGFTGSPFSVRALAEAMANAGHSVEMPLLPGHGTVVEDMIPTRWEDWSGAAEFAFQALSARTERIVVAGLSMGGALTCWLAENHPEIAGLILVNPLVEYSAELAEGAKALLDSGVEVMDAIGSDIAIEGADERSYPATPLAPAVSLFAAVEEVSAHLGAIAAPILLFSSVQDHVVPFSNGDHLVASVAGPIERVILERSYHVATLDHDAELIEAQSVAFVERIANA